jgi:YD repeat-containing protein
LAATPSQAKRKPPLFVHTRYDDLGRLTRVTDPFNNQTDYAYDDAGNRTSVTDARGKVTTWTYDPQNRVTSVTDPLNHTTTYEYLCPCQLAGVRFCGVGPRYPGTEERVGGPGGGDSSPWSPAWTRRNKTARHDPARGAWQDALAKGPALAA